MATTSLWKVKQRMDHVIEYVSDEKKTTLQHTLDYMTDEQKTIESKLVSTLNCSSMNPLQSMQNTKKLFKDTKPIVCFHGFQSFESDEVSPEVAHEIGIKLANQLWGDRYEVVIATHTNTSNVHTHFVLNATSFVDGKRFTNSKKDYKQMREASDALCREYGLSVILEEKDKAMSRSKYYNELSLREKVRCDIDESIKSSLTMSMFTAELKRKGYEVKGKGDNISLKHPQHKRSVRLSSLGDAYSYDSLIEIMNANEVQSLEKVQNVYEKHLFDINPILESYHKKELKTFIYEFIDYQVRIGVIREAKRTSTKYSNELKLAMKYIDEISQQTIFLVKSKVETYEELLDCKSTLANQLEELTNARSSYYKRSRSSKVKVEKELLKSKAKSLTPEIKELRNKLALCMGIEGRSMRIKEFNKEMNLERKERSR